MSTEPNFDRMTDRARRVMALAEESACRRGSASVRPVHVLLGLARERGGLAAHVLEDLGADAETLTRRLDELAPAAAAPSEPPLPLDESTRRLLTDALEECAALAHRYVGTEHLVLAVARSTDETVTNLLAASGLRPESIREETYSILGHGL